MLINKFRGFGAIALGLAIVGCSGSGTDEPMLHRIALGDQWVLAGTISDGTTSSNIEVSVNTVNQTLDGVTYPTLLRSRVLDGVPTHTAGDLFTQGDNRDIVVVGTVKDEEAPVAVPHELFLPGRLTIGYSWSVVNTADPLDDQTFQVVSSETLSTPAGTFLTYKIHGTTADGTSSDRWLAPSIGYFAKTINTRPTETGAEVETKVLQSTTVSH